MNYEEFVNWITDSAAKEINEKSGEFEKKKINGIELRFAKINWKSDKYPYPSNENIENWRI